MEKVDRPRRAGAGKRKSRLDPSPGHEGPQWVRRSTAVERPRTLNAPAALKGEPQPVQVTPDLDAVQVTPEWAQQPGKARGGFDDREGPPSAGAKDLAPTRPQPFAQRAPFDNFDLPSSSQPTLLLANHHLDLNQILSSRAESETQAEAIIEAAKRRTL